MSTVTTVVLVGVCILFGLAIGRLYLNGRTTDKAPKEERADRHRIANALFWADMVNLCAVSSIWTLMLFAVWAVDHWADYLKADKDLNGVVGVGVVAMIAIAMSMLFVPWQDIFTKFFLNDKQKQIYDEDEKRRKESWDKKMAWVKSKLGIKAKQAEPMK